MPPRLTEETLKTTTTSKQQPTGTSQIQTVYSYGSTSTATDFTDTPPRYSEDSTMNTWDIYDTSNPNNSSPSPLKRFFHFLQKYYQIAIIIVTLLFFLYKLTHDTVFQPFEIADIAPSATVPSFCTNTLPVNQSKVKIIRTSRGNIKNFWDTDEYCHRKPIPPCTAYINSYKNKAKLHINDRSIPTFKGTEILGFGTSITEASALNVMSLPRASQVKFVDLMFSRDNGLGLSLTRTHINSCDFSVSEYDYDGVDNDFDLKHFDNDLKHDVDSGLIPLMMSADVKVKEWNNGGGLKIIATPWSPPSWMKLPSASDVKDGFTHASKMTNLNSDNPNQCLKDGTSNHSKYAKAWALYISKWLTSYKHKGLNVFALTIQNEPLYNARWEACVFNSTAMSEFLNLHLGPTIRHHNAGVRILGFDHNLFDVVDYTAGLLPPPASTASSENSSENSSANSYLDGIAYHWYAKGDDRVLDGSQGNANLHKLAEMVHGYNTHTTGVNQLQYNNNASNSSNNSKDDDDDDNNLIFLATEACHCPSTGYASGDFKNVAFSRGERYVHSILADLSSGSSGWIDWNAVLDMNGGPNHLGNLCDAMVVTDVGRIRATASSDGEDDGEDEDEDEDDELVIGEDDVEQSRSKQNEWITDETTPNKDKNKNKLNTNTGSTMSHKSITSKFGTPVDIQNVGLITQPLYYLYGQISRYIPPGSHAVSCLLNGNNAFLPNRHLLNNDISRVGTEVSMWPCEGSVRQKFTILPSDVGGYIIRSKSSGVNHAYNYVCIGKAFDEHLGTLTFVSCEDMHNIGMFELDTAEMQIRLLSNSEVEMCLMILPLADDGGAKGWRGGSMVGLGACVDNKDKMKKLTYNTERHEVHFHNPDAKSGSDSHEYEEIDVCMTIGHPFLQSGCFYDPTNDENVIVLLNEGDVGVSVDVRDVGVVVMEEHEVVTLVF